MVSPPLALPTVEIVIAWLLRSGLQICLIVGVSLLSYLTVKRTVPHVMRLALVKPAEGADTTEQLRRYETLNGVFLRTVQILLAVIAGFMILAAFEVNIAPGLAGLSIFGVALGLGAQSIVKDCLSGMLILFENQYAVGDIVRLGTVSGVVESFSLRRTVLRDQDGSVHFVPNSEIKIATNLTRDWSRVNIDLTLDYTADLDQAIAIIDRVGQDLAEAEEWAPIIMKPPQFVRVDKYVEIGLVIKVVGETRPGKQWSVTGELLRRLRREFAAAGIRVATARTLEPLPPPPPTASPPPTNPFLPR